MNDFWQITVWFDSVVPVGLVTIVVIIATKLVDNLMDNPAEASIDFYVALIINGFVSFVGISFYSNSFTNN